MYDPQVGYSSYFFRGKGRKKKNKTVYPVFERAVEPFVRWRQRHRGPVSRPEGLGVAAFPLRASHRWPPPAALRASPRSGLRSRPPPARSCGGFLRRPDTTPSSPCRAKAGRPPSTGDGEGRAALGNGGQGRREGKSWLGGSAPPSSLTTGGDELLPIPHLRLLWSQAVNNHVFASGFCTRPACLGKTASELVGG